MSTESSESCRVIGRVYVVRHGETQENRDGVIQGQRDTKLNEAGERQAALVGERLRDVKIDWAVSSDLQRAVKTAEAVIGFHEKIELERDTRLRERALGEMEGQKAGLRAVGGQKGVESASELRGRGISWWDERVVGGLKEGETGLVVSHGGWITSLIRELIRSGRAVALGEMAAKCRCKNGSISQLDVLDDRTARVVLFADVAHWSLDSLDSLDSAADQIHT